METTFRLIKFKIKKRYFYSLPNFTQREIILVTTSIPVHLPPSPSFSNFSISPLQSRNFAPFPLFLTKLVKSSQKIGRFSRRLTFKESRGCSILVVRYSKAARSINNGCNQSVIIATRHNHGRTISHKQCSESWLKWATTFDPCDTGTWYEFNILDGGQT